MAQDTSSKLSLIQTAQSRFPYPLRVALLGAAIFLFLLVRNYPAFALPVLHCEDGREMLSFYTLFPAPEGILRFYGGYVSLLPNVIGYMSVQWLPLTLTPYALAIYPLALASVTYSLLALRRFRFLIASDQWRFFLAFFLACLPLGNVHLISNTAYSIWNLLLLLLLLAIAPSERSILFKLAQFVFMTLAVLSTPLSIVIAPICAVNAVQAKKRVDQGLNVGLIGVIILYLLFGVQTSMGTVSNLGLHTVPYTLRYLLERVVYEAVFGNRLRLDLYQEQMLWPMQVTALGICLAFAVFVYVRRDRFTRQDFINLLLLVYLIATITGLVVITRTMTDSSHMDMWNMRYFYTQRVLLWIVAAMIVFKGINWRFSPKYAQLLLGAILLLYAWGIWHQNRYVYDTLIEAGRELANFLQEVDTAKRELAPGQSAEYLLEPYCFEIRLRYTGE
jgi:hypothetical protein